MPSNLLFSIELSLSGIKLISKFVIPRIQFSKTMGLDLKSILYYNIYNLSGIKFLMRLKLGLSHLKEHKFNHSFYDCVNPFCTYSLEPESVSHFH